MLITDFKCQYSKAMSCQKSQVRIQDSELLRKISSKAASCEIILV